MSGSEVEKFLTIINEKCHKLAKLISPITDHDRKLFDSYLSTKITRDKQSKKSMNLNFEDSFEYIRMYFNSGNFLGFKLYDNENLLVFAVEKKKKIHIKIFKPLGPGGFEALTDLINLCAEITLYPIHLVCVNDKLLKNIKDSSEIEVTNIKEFKYYIYDLNLLNNLKGTQWKNVRQKINSFKKSNPKIKIQRLMPENSNDVVHFIGAWRRNLLTNRALSYSNLEKNKFAARYYSNRNDLKNVWGMVYKLKGRVVAFQMLYRLSTTVAAHTIGLADPEVKGLSEFTQIHVWNLLAEGGIRYINDGASWRPGLDRYKRKFNPTVIQKIFECKCKIKIKK
jgi:hypothetical protein